MHPPQRPGWAAPGGFPTGLGVRILRRAEQFQRPAPRRDGMCRSHRHKNASPDAWGHGEGPPLRSIVHAHRPQHGLRVLRCVVLMVTWYVTDAKNMHVSAWIGRSSKLQPPSASGDAGFGGPQLATRIKKALRYVLAALFDACASLAVRVRLPDTFLACALLDFAGSRTRAFGPNPLLAPPLANNAPGAPAALSKSPSSISGAVSQWQSVSLVCDGKASRSRGNLLLLSSVGRARH